MSYPAAEDVPANQPHPGNPAPAARPRNRLSATSLAFAVLACAAAAFGIYVVASIDRAASGCLLIDDGLDAAAGLTVVAGGILSMGAVAAGFIALIGRVQGINRVIAIAGLALGLVAMLVCAGYFLIPIGPLC